MLYLQSGGSCSVLDPRDFLNFLISSTMLNSRFQMLSDSHKHTLYIATWYTQKLNSWANTYPCYLEYRLTCFLSCPTLPGPTLPFPCLSFPGRAMTIMNMPLSATQINDITPKQSSCGLPWFSYHDPQGILWFGSCLTSPPYVQPVLVLTFHLFFLFLYLWPKEWLPFSQVARISGSRAFVKVFLLHGKLSTQLYPLCLITVYSFLKIQPTSSLFPPCLNIDWAFTELIN